MKISCQSCEARYTIADEKVRGKVVKIRCKKCSATIVIKGTELASGQDYDDAPTRVLDRDGFPAASGSSGFEWTLNVTEDDQRTVATSELVELYRAGIIDDDTYAWREGLDDWLPLGQIPELRELLTPKSEPSFDVDARASFPSPPSSPRAAVRRPEAGASSKDLFGTAAFIGKDDDLMTSASGSPVASSDSQQMTGARNESSVLFSLSALTGAANQARPAGSADESSSIVDIKALMDPLASAPKKPTAASKVDDIMNLGGGGIFAPTLAAPILSPASDNEAGSPGSASSQSAPSKGKNGMMFAALGILALAAIGTGAFFLLGKDDTAKVAEASSGAALPAANAPGDEAAPAPTPVEKADTVAPAEAPSPSQPPSAALAETTAAQAPQDVQPAVAREKDKAPATTPAPAKAAEKQAEKAIPAAAKPAATPKPAAPPPPPPPSTEAPPFDRAAALSTLNAASDSAAACKKPDGPTGSGRIAVTFAPSGVVTTAMVEGPPFAGTAVGGCVAAKFRSARVPAFSGGMVTVRKSFTIN